MTKRFSRMGIWFPGMLLVIGLPLIGKWSRGTHEKLCALDGARIDPLYRVRLEAGSNQEHEFCCIRCAGLWLSRHNSKSSQIFVTDESTGQEIHAQSAWFVRSSVVSVPHTQNRIHAFGTQANAARHAQTAHGTILSGSEKPFAASAQPESSVGRNTFSSNQK